MTTRAASVKYMSRFDRVWVIDRPADHMHEAALVPKAGNDLGAEDADSEPVQFKITQRSENVIGSSHSDTEYNELCYC
jgi:hypothetical protein